MKEKILPALKTKFKDFGFSAKTLEQVAEYLGQSVQDDTAIEPAVNGAEILLKAFQSEIDKRVAAVTPKPDPKPEPKPEPTPEPVNNKPEDALAKALEQINKRLEMFERKEQAAALQGKVNAALKEKGIPESFYRGRVTIDKPEDIENVIKQVDEDFTAMRQELVNSGVIISTPAEPGGDKADAAIAKQIAEKRNNPSAATNGVEAKKLI